MKPQDILIAVKIQSLDDQAGKSAIVWPQRQLADEAGLSLSEVSAACRRLEEVGLLTREPRKVVKSCLLEFLVHGLKYVFAAKAGEIVRGTPTGYAASPLKEHFLSGTDEFVPVWPDAKGEVRGAALKPLYKSVPSAAKRDARLYEYLVLIDAIRAGRARERSEAISILSQRLE